MTIKTVLFDFDGTLFDTVEGITRSVRYALNKIGLDAPLEALRCFAGPPLLDMFMEKFGLTEEQAEQAVRDYRERYKPIGIYESRPFPGMAELLRDLRRAGLRLGVATSKPQNMAEQLLEQEHMTDLLDGIFGADPMGGGNAKWQVIQRAMEALGAEADSTVLVGDTKYDVFGAQRCGIPCIGVRFGYAAEGELEAAGAAAIAEDPAALKALLCGELS